MRMFRAPGKVRMGSHEEVEETKGQQRVERVTREDLQDHLRVTVHSESSNKNGARGINT